MLNSSDLSEIDRHQLPEISSYEVGSVVSNLAGSQDRAMIKGAFCTKKGALVRTGESTRIKERSSPRDPFASRSRATKKSRNFQRPIIVGLAGGTGSGKSTFVAAILKGLDTRDVIVISHDSYYRDRSLLPVEDRANINYDHPDALETFLLLDHLRRLLEGKAVEIPIYDLVTHTRRPEIRRLKPCKVIIVEGILILADPELRELLDIKVFIDADADIRFIRRMERDLTERGRTRESVVKQYTESTRAMHFEFVEPSRRFADVIVPGGGQNSVAVDMLLAKIRRVVKH